MHDPISSCLLNLVKDTRFDDGIRTDVGQPIRLRRRGRRPDRMPAESVDELDASHTQRFGSVRMNPFWKPPNARTWRSRSGVGPVRVPPAPGECSMGESNTHARHAR
jgi:hypothetical protein